MGESRFRSAPYSPLNRDLPRTPNPDLICLERPTQPLVDLGVSVPDLTVTFLWTGENSTNVLSP